MSIWILLLIAGTLASPAFSKSIRLARFYLLTFFGVGFAGFLFFLNKYFSQTYPPDLGPLPLVEVVSWAPSLGLSLNFYIDGVSLLFLGLITGLGFFIQVFSFFYFDKQEYWPRYLTPICLFMTAMVGLCVSNNLILFFIFWELTSISSYFLIAFDREDEKSRKNARNGLLVTLGGGASILAGFIILMNFPPGISQFTDLPNLIESLIGTPELNFSIILILIGVFTKSAQWPFHFWLPGAMSAPAPVSAYLHSATLVKAGIFLALRMTPLFSSFSLWTDSLLVFGSITYLWSSLVALFETQFKKILAYTTLAALGLSLFLMGLNIEKCFAALFVFLIAHGLYKAPLFLSAGIIEKCLSEKDLRPLGRLWKFLPWLCPSIIVCGLSMAGFPPFLGFIAKEEILSSLLDEKNSLGTFLSIGIITIGSLLTIAVSFRFAGTLVLRRATVRKEHSLPKGKESFAKTSSAVVNCMGFFSLFFGFFPSTLNSLVTMGLKSVEKSHFDFVNPANLHLWHGFSPLLILSLTLLLTGIVLYFFHHRIAAFSATEKNPFPLVRIFEGLLNLALAIGGKIHRIIQNGKLPIYIFVFFLIFLLGVSAQSIGNGFSFFVNNLFPKHTQNDPISFYEISLILVMLGSTLYCGLTKSAWGAIVLLGVVGYSIALIFSNFGATDLAMTQICIESLALIIFVKLLPKMPEFKNFTSKSYKVTQMILAAFVGLVVSYLAFVNLTHGPVSSLTPYFNENSLVSAHGRNVVNVIIVDFRGLDTMGEISVLAIAALGIAGLLGFNWFSNQKSKKGEAL